MKRQRISIQSSLLDLEINGTRDDMIITHLT